MPDEHGRLEAFADTGGWLSAGTAVRRDIRGAAESVAMSAELDVLTISSP
jgi:hypothetical protein